jgi:hypothetical protein
VDERIYVVGYPKSGNTWLVRLLADALGAPVLDGVMDGSPEMACDVNSELELSEQSPFRVAKVHYPVEVFLDRVDPRPRLVVYIVRDVRDVCISAFHYFRPEGGWERGIPLRRLRSLVRRAASRRRLQSEARAFSDGSHRLVRKWGTWESHAVEWAEYIEDHESVLGAVVRYEDLREDATGVLKSLLGTLHLPVPDDRRIQEAVERQSFPRLREQYARSGRGGAPETRTKGDFFRRGGVREWKSRLDSRTLEKIDANQGEVLSRLGYGLGGAGSSVGSSA